MKTQEWQFDDFFISTDPALLDIEVIHGFLKTSYWSPGIPQELVEKAVRNSLCLGIYHRATSGRPTQVGFARVISDFATFAYLADVFVLEGFRERGLSKNLMDCIMTLPELQGLRRFCLGTRDAHGLYRQYGFEVIAKPENWMEIRQAAPYGQPG
jgi:GNAT superfamily N-acetyltransferase